VSQASSQPGVAAPAGGSLLAPIARRESGSFRRAIDAFGPLVWSIARTYCANPADAEDAAQEAFLKLWRVAGQYDARRGSEAAFVVVVARRSVLDFRRTTRRQASGVERAAQRHAPERAPRAANDDTRRASEAMSLLPTEQQDALRLAVQRGLTQEAISGVLGVPLGTVKTRIRTALIRLRDTLDVERRPGALSPEGTP
jgi:RNA polymerase sigma-70 factor (ECF subfamily)